MDENDAKNTVPTTATVIMVDPSATNPHISTDKDDSIEVRRKQSSGTPIATSVSIEMQKKSIVKELSSREDTTQDTEVVLMVELEKKGTTTIHPAPPTISTSDIDLNIAKETPVVPKRSVAKMEDEEEITVDTSAAPVAGTTHQSTEWVAGGCSSSSISESKRSIGPYQYNPALGGPSGISILLPRKSFVNYRYRPYYEYDITSRSGITISISKVTNIGKELHNIPTDKFDSRLLLEIQHFSTLISFQDYDMTAYGLFALDATLLSKVLASAAMYVIILVQFDSGKS